MKPFRPLFFFLFLALSLTRVFGQMPANFQTPLQVPSGDISNPKFIYFLSPVSGIKSTTEGLSFRNYELGYEIGYSDKKVTFSNHGALVAFWGFKSSLLSGLDIFWGKPSDINIQPCAHNLMCDVLLKSIDNLEVDNPSSLKLVVVEYTKSKPLSDLIAATTTAPKNTGGLMYVVWNQEHESQLPAILKDAPSSQMAVTQQVKVIGKLAASGAAATTAAVGAGVAAQTPAKTVQPAKTQPAPKKEEKKVPAAKPAAPKPEKSELAVAEVAQAPAISEVLYPLFWKFINKTDPKFSRDQDTLLLSLKNDSLIIKNRKNLGFTRGYFPITLWDIPITFEKSVCASDLCSDEVFNKLVTFNLKKAKFSAMGQRLFTIQDKSNPGTTTLRLPDFCNSLEDIRFDWGISATMRPSSGDIQPETPLVFTPKTATVNLTVTDANENFPIPGCYVEFLLGGAKKLYNMKIQPGDPTPELFYSDDLYTVKVKHPDYKTGNFLLKMSDFEQGASFALQSRPALNIYYVAPEMQLRKNMISSVEEKLQVTWKLKRKFLLYVSRSDKALMTSEEQRAQEIVDRIPELFDEKPMLRTDEANILREVRTIQVPRSSKVNLHFYMSEELYKAGGEAFIVKIYTSLNSIFSSDSQESNIFCHIYLDADVDNKKVFETRNETIKTTKSFTYYNLLKE